MARTILADQLTLHMYINQGGHIIPTTLLLAQPLRIFRPSYILSKTGVVGINLDFYPCVENDFVNVVPKC